MRWQKVWVFEHTTISPVDGGKKRELAGLSFERPYLMTNSNVILSRNPRISYLKFLKSAKTVSATKDHLPQRVQWIQRLRSVIAQLRFWVQKYRFYNWVFGVINSAFSELPPKLLEVATHIWRLGDLFLSLLGFHRQDLVTMNSSFRLKYGW